MADNSPINEQEIAVRLPLFTCADGKSRIMLTPSTAGAWDYDGAFGLWWDSSGGGSMKWQQRAAGVWSAVPLLSLAGASLSTPLQIISTLAGGTSPLSITSTTLCTNLNADLLDGHHSTDFITGSGTSKHFSFSSHCSTLTNTSALIS